MRTLLVQVIFALSFCIATMVSAQDEGGAGGVVSPDATDEAIMRKSLRQAREERRRKAILASYCLPVLLKLKKEEKTTDLTSENCVATGFSGGDFLTLREGLLASPGVADVQLGFMGGWKREPRYKDVCLGGTGHTEMVIVAYNSEVTNYTNLLGAFMKSHNPRSRVQPGDFAGIQFKSVVYLLDHPQLWAFTQLKKKMDALPEYKQDQLWVLTEPTALKERPNNFWPEYGSEESLKQIRNETVKKVEAKVQKLQVNIDKIAAEAEKDMAQMQKENSTKEVILLEKDMGEDQAANYKKATEAEKKVIAADRAAMMSNAMKGNKTESKNDTAIKKNGNTTATKVEVEGAATTASPAPVTTDVNKEADGTTKETATAKPEKNETIIAAPANQEEKKEVAKKNKQEEAPSSPVDEVPKKTTGDTTAVGEKTKALSDPTEDVMFKAAKKKAEKAEPEAPKIVSDEKDAKDSTPKEVKEIPVEVDAEANISKRKVQVPAKAQADEPTPVKKQVEE